LRYSVVTDWQPYDGAARRVPEFVQGGIWMKRALFVGVVAGNLSAGAGAEVVTFTGIPYDVSPTSMTSYVENGVTVTSLEGNFWAYPNPGELHFDPDGFGNKTFDFTYAGGAFNVLNFDITFADSSFVAFLEGFDQNGALLNSLVVSSTLGTISVAGFDGIHTLRIGNFGSHMSIDNFTISAAVPEPATWVTMLVGFGFAGAALRRSRARLQTA
jgi:hypothetical protein